MSRFPARHSLWLVLLMTACSQEPKSARYTVEEYRADDRLREATVKECANDPGTLARKPDCINAQRAASLESHGSLRDLPPIGLDPRNNPLGKKNPDSPSSR